MLARAIKLKIKKLVQFVLQYKTHVQTHVEGYGTRYKMNNITVTVTVLYKWYFWTAKLMQNNSHVQNYASISFSIVRYILLPVSIQI